jgi:hypothetical protein
MAEYARMSEPSVELLIALKCEEQLLGATFLPMSDRAFSVGACGHVDFYINAPSLNAVEFYIERQGNYLYIIPGYRGRRLRLNGDLVTGPVPLPEHSRIEFGSMIMMGRIYARTVVPTNEPLRPSVRVVKPGALPPGCFPIHGGVDAVSITNDTVIVGTPSGPKSSTWDTQDRSAEHTVQTTAYLCALSPSEYVPPAIVANRTVTLASPMVLGHLENTMRGPLGTVELPIPTQIGTARSDEAPPPGPSRTVVVSRLSVDQVDALLSTGASQMPQSRVAPSPSVAPSFGLQRDISVSVEPQEVSPNIDVNEKSDVGVAPQLKHRNTDAKDESSNRVALEVDVQREGSVEPPKRSLGTVSKQRWQAPTAEYSAVELPMLKGSIIPRNVALNSIRRRSNQTVLARIGVWARKRPVGVFALALSSGLGLALFFVFILRVSQRPNVIAKSNTQVTTTQVVLPKEVSQSIAPAGVSATTVSTAPPMSASGTPGIITLETTAVSSPMVLKAIEHLVAGRHSEALRAYEKLMENSPNDEVVRSTVRILTFRLSRECEPNSDGKPHANQCPELLP